MKKFGILWLVILFCLLALPVLLLAEPITLSLSDHNPDVSWGPVHATQPWVKKIEELTNGRLKIVIYPSQTLAKGTQNWNAVKSGIADMSWNVMTFYPGLTPYADVITLPGLPYETSEKSGEILWKLYEKFPEMQEQFAENKLLVLYGGIKFSLLTQKVKIDKLEDIKGLKIRTVGGPMVEAVKAYGANPVAIPMPDCYLAMQKGTVDGVAASWEPMPGFRLQELTKYYNTNIPLGNSYFAIIMNKKKWASLPKDIQDAVMSVSGLKGAKWFGKNFFDSAAEEVPKLFKEQGYNIIVNSLSDEERQRWVEIGCKPIWENWVKRMEKQRYSKARDVLNAAIEFSKQ